MLETRVEFLSIPGKLAIAKTITVSLPTVHAGRIDQSLTSLIHHENFDSYLGWDYKRN